MLSGIEKLFISIAVPHSVGQQVNRFITPDTLIMSHPANYHLTVLYLGDCPKQKTEEAKRIISTLNIQAFDISTEEIGYFSDNDKISNLHLAIKEGYQELTCIHQLLVKEFGITSTPYPSFTPHITICRHIDTEQTEAKNLAQKKLDTPIIFKASALELLTKRRTTSDRKYTQLLEIALT